MIGPPDLPEFRDFIRSRRAALFGFMKQGAALELDGNALRVIPRNDIYVRYLNDNRAVIADLATQFYHRAIDVVVQCGPPTRAAAGNGSNPAILEAIQVASGGNGKPTQTSASEPALSNGHRNGNGAGPGETEAVHEIPRRPPRCVIEWDKVLDFLIARPQWLLWRYEYLKGKWTKPPYQPNRRNGSSTDSNTWSDWESIQIAFDSDTEGDRFFDGIGFVLTADLGIVGSDFDHCYNPDTGVTDPTVARFLEILGSATEITPGGDGFRVFTFGTLPQSGRKRGDFPKPGMACECYTDGRYLTVTGRRFGETSEIVANQAGIDEVHAAIFAERIAKQSRAQTNRGSVGAALNIPDEELLERARKAANGERFAALYDRGDWQGQGFPSQSEADLALSSSLVFWTGRDADRTDRLFRASGLMRPKWDRNGYAAHTIETAVASCTDVYREPDRRGFAPLAVQNGHAPSPAASLLELPDFSKKKLEPLTWKQMGERRLARNREWVVDGKLARRETSLWSGKVEAGKTTAMRELALCVLRGEPFLGCETIKGRVAYIMLDADGEDGTYDAFEAMGFTEGDGENTYFLFEPMLAQINHGLEYLVSHLVEFKPALVIVDPYPRLKLIEDFHSYTLTYLMALLSHLARELNAHFALPGHIPRGRDDDADVATTGFGSVAVSGGVNARFTVTNRNGMHTVRSSQGKGGGFKAFAAEYVLREDAVTKRITLGDAWSWKDKARGQKAAVLQFLDSHDERCFDSRLLAQNLRIQRSIAGSAANMLYSDQEIKREGDGLAGNPYIYASLRYSGRLTVDEVKRA